jgi:hypothetical protein
MLAGACVPNHEPPSVVTLQPSESSAIPAGPVAPKVRADASVVADASDGVRWFVVTPTDESSQSIAVSVAEAFAIEIVDRPNDTPRMLRPEWRLVRVQGPLETVTRQPSPNGWSSFVWSDGDIWNHMGGGDATLVFESFDSHRHTKHTLRVIAHFR